MSKLSLLLRQYVANACVAWVLSAKHAHEEVDSFLERTMPCRLEYYKAHPPTISAEEYPSCT